MKFLIVASGPSTRASDVHRMRDHVDRVMVLKENWRIMPDAEYMYAADGLWWDWYADATAKGFKGERWTQHEGAARKYGLRHVTSYARRGLCRMPGVIHQGRNSGYQAINLAYHFGAREIFLIGFDMRVLDNRLHHFDTEPAPIDLPVHDFADWRARMGELACDLDAEGIPVVNLSPESALDCFQKKSVDSIIKGG